MNLDKELKIAKKAALAAGKIMMKHYGNVRKLQFKHDKSRLTEIDLMCEKKILALIKTAFPNHSIHSEEKGDMIKDSDFLWAVDPLDGTTNYSVMMPYFNASIGLFYKGRPVLGVVYYPVQKELFYAVEGKGAYMNGKKIHVSKNVDFDKSVIAFCYGYDNKKQMERGMTIFKRLRAKLLTRQMGSAALELAYVACGRLEAFEMSHMNPHDVGAGSIIVKEAGGKVTDFKNKPFTAKSIDILASNSKLHSKILKILNKR